MGTALAAGGHALGRIVGLRSVAAAAGLRIGTTSGRKLPETSGAVTGACGHGHGPGPSARGGDEARPLLITTLPRKLPKTWWRHRKANV